MPQTTDRTISTPTLFVGGSDLPSPVPVLFPRVEAIERYAIGNKSSVPVPADYYIGVGGGGDVPPLSMAPAIGATLRLHVCAVVGTLRG